MSNVSKALLCTAGAAALAVSTTPAMARDGGIDAGTVIAGALVIGGIAAIAASAGHDRYDDGYGGYAYDRAGYNTGNYGYGYRGTYGSNYYRTSPREAVERCVATAERNAARYSYGRADVTDIRDIRPTRYGYEVRGRIAVNSLGRSWRYGDRAYGRGWNGDYRGWNSNLRGYDSGSFTCRVERDRVVDLDYSGIRGL